MKLVKVLSDELEGITHNAISNEGFNIDLFREIDYEDNSFNAYFCIGISGYVASSIEQIEEAIGSLKAWKELLTSKVMTFPDYTIESDTDDGDLILYLYITKEAYEAIQDLDEI